MFKKNIAIFMCMVILFQFIPHTVVEADENIGDINLQTANVKTEILASDANAQKSTISISLDGDAKNCINSLKYSLKDEEEKDVFFSQYNASFSIDCNKVENVLEIELVKTDEDIVTSIGTSEGISIENNTIRISKEKLQSYINLQINVSYNKTITLNVDNEGKFSVQENSISSDVATYELQDDNKTFVITGKKHYPKVYVGESIIKTEKLSGSTKYSINEKQTGTVKIRMIKDDEAPELKDIYKEGDSNRKAVLSKNDDVWPEYTYYSNEEEFNLNIISEDNDSQIYGEFYNIEENDEMAKKLKDNTFIFDRESGISDYSQFYFWITDYCNNQKKFKLNISIDVDPPKLVEDSIEDIDSNGKKDTSIITSSYGGDGRYWEKGRDHYIAFGLDENNLDPYISYNIINDDTNEVVKTVNKQDGADDNNASWIKMLSDGRYRLTVKKDIINDLQDGTYVIEPTLDDKAKNTVTFNNFYTFTIGDTVATVTPEIEQSPVWTSADGENTVEEVSATLFTNKKIDDISYMVTDSEDKPDAEDTNWVKAKSTEISHESDGTKANVTYCISYGGATEGTHKYYFWMKVGNNKIFSAANCLVYNIDKTSPELSNLSAQVQGDGNLDRVFRFIFGSFIKDTQTLTLTLDANDQLNAQYDQEYVPENEDISKRIKYVKLYYLASDGTEGTDPEESIEDLYNRLEKKRLKEKTLTLNDEGHYTCQIEVPENNKFYKMYFVAEDRAGNKRIEPVKALSNTSSLVLVDEIAPDVKVQINEDAKSPDYVGGHKDWYIEETEVDYSLEVRDNESGIYSVKTSINGVEIDKDKTGKTLYKTTDFGTATRETTESYTISTKQGEVADDGSLKIDILVEDNAGNSKSVDKKVYVDKDSPVISNILFDSRSDEITTVPKQYGYFFTKQTDVTVSATDFIGETKNIGSGVKSITYSLIPADDSEIITETLAVEEVSDKLGTYRAKFTIPQGFKGQISIYVTDNVGHKCKTYNPKGVVIENAQQHDESSDVDIILPKTNYKDSEGNPLYNKKINVKAVVEDTRSGLAEADLWMGEYYNDEPLVDDRFSVKSKYNDKTEKWTSTITGAEGWKLPDEPELNLVKRATKTVVISSETNHMTASLGLKDNAGNVSREENVVFSIDKTAPKIEVEYDNNSVENEKYYKDSRTATITVTDANFSQEDVVVDITGPEVNISKWKHTAADGCDGKVHTAECSYSCIVSFIEDGDYTLTVNATDLAGNKGSYGKTDEFTIDKTAPVVKVSYNNNSKSNGNYFSNSRTATIEITDRNFDNSRTNVDIKAKNENGEIGAPKASAFTQSGDVWTATVTFVEDANYSISVESTDMAGNEGNKYDTEEFVIDTSRPQITIEGVEDKSANNDVVEPVIKISDTNIEDGSLEIMLEGVNNGNIEFESSKTQTSDTINVNISDLPHEQQMDDLYTLSVKISDKAGNTNTESRTFSINRFGSVYVLSDETQALVDKYYTNKEQDIVVTEINVDLLEKSSIDYSLDGMTTALTEGQEYEVEKDVKEGSWKTYEYHIGKDKFNTEGKYVISLYSEDKAKNKSTNRTKGIDIGFVVDKTAPTIVVTGVDNGKHYVDSEKKIYIDVQDNILVDSMEMYNNKELVLSKESDEVLDNNGVITTKVTSSDNWQTIYVEARDAAGNAATGKKIRFLLTTNLLVQLRANAMAIGGIIIGITFGTAGIVAIVRRPRFFGRKHERIYK
ncbi:MAG: Ig-like domain-containing protein [Agathobacter sp.]|nr:Ig-like domain-containing protein [Agathobacter sp.]